MTTLALFLTLLFLVVIPLCLFVALVTVMIRLECLALRAKDGGK